MTRARTLQRLTAGLVLAAAAALSAGCVVAPIPGPVIGPPVVVGPRPVIVVPHGRRHHHHGYYHGRYRWR